MSIESCLFVGDILTSLSETGFTIANGRKFVFAHHQACCEDVRHIGTVGAYDQVLGSPIKEFSTSNEELPGYDKEYYSSYTWTSFHIITEAGNCVVLYFLGESNGYYGEDVGIYNEGET